MKTLSRSLSPASIGLTLAVASLTTSGSSFAQDRVVRFERIDSVSYPVEVEVHGSVGEDNTYGNQGYGAGVRASIPVVAGFLARRYPENLALSFGGDLLNYDNCYYAARCGANYLMVPLAAQWNLFLARRVSLLVEAGVFAYRGFFDGCGTGAVGCNSPTDFGILPTIALGARVRIAPNLALVARLAYPASTLGISFL